LCEAIAAARVREAAQGKWYVHPDDHSSLSLPAYVVVFFYNARKILCTITGGDI